MRGSLLSAALHHLVYLHASLLHELGDLILGDLALLGIQPVRNAGGLDLLLLDAREVGLALDLHFLGLAGGLVLLVAQGHCLGGLWFPDQLLPLLAGEAVCRDSGCG